MEAISRRSAGTPIIVAMAVFVVIAVVVAVALSGGNIVVYEPGTPEAAAQEYVQALFDDDYDAAYALLSPGLQSRCDALELTGWRHEPGESATFAETRVTGTTARIDVIVSSDDYGPEPFAFGSNDFDRLVALELEFIDGHWLVADAPWPLGSCSWR